jgi:beta-N-acetylhexosaminidase
MIMTFEELVGRRLVFGLVGPDLTDTDVRLFRDTQAGGIMLYRRNFETPERFRALIDGLEAAVGRRLLITTDHEGSLPAPRAPRTSWSGRASSRGGSSGGSAWT